MIVRVRAGAASVEDADDCARLHVESTLDREAVARALAETGTGTLTADGDVLLDLGALHDRARAAATAADWEDRWQAMVGYAARKGWLSADGHGVQAHLVAG